MSEVTICNLALSHLGDTATVASIKPPDSSVQAQLCARFYYIARNSLLEMQQWSFATKRVQPAQLTLPTFTDEDGNTNNGPWAYAYAVPGDMLAALAVIDPDAVDDYEAFFGAVPDNGEVFPPYPQGYVPVPGAPLKSPQPYVIETQTDGTKILLTNVPSAVLRYTALVTDTTKFSNLFMLALSYFLASMLAGPILKGDAGIAAAEQMLTLFEATRGKASASDANQSQLNLQPATDWIRGR
jgi:hypothetical protein